MTNNKKRCKTCKGYGIAPVRTIQPDSHRDDLTVKDCTEFDTCPTCLGTGEERSCYSCTKLYYCHITAEVDKGCDGWIPKGE